MAEIVKTVKTSGGDYTSIISWESGEQTNLVTAGNTHKVECDAFQESAGANQFVLAGWTTGASNYITMQGMGTIALPYSSTATYTFNTTYYVSSTYVFEVQQTYTRIYDIQVEPVTGGAWGVSLSVGYVRVDRMVIRAPSGRLLRSNQTTNEVSNVLAIGTGTISVGFYCVGGVFTNCMVFCHSLSGTSDGFYAASGTPTYRNCVVFGCTSNRDYSGTETAINCATSQASGSSGLAGTDPVYEITDKWSDSSTDNFRFHTFPELQGQGSDGSAQTTTDILGEERTGTWDIGVFERPEAGMPGGLVGAGLLGPGLLNKGLAG